MNRLTFASWPSGPAARAAFARTTVSRLEVPNRTKEKSMTKATTILVTSLLLLLFPILVSAQATSSTSSVTGIVTDTTGAVITGANVTLTDTKTSKELKTTTDEKGVYRFVQVPPGQGYTLTFTNPGFQTLTITDVALGVGITETHNVQL